MMCSCIILVGHRVRDAGCMLYRIFFENMLVGGDKDAVPTVENESKMNTYVRRCLYVHTYVRTI
jgi:hypothetical protein